MLLVRGADYGPSSLAVTGLMAVGLVSGLANGYNGALLEGALPRLRVHGVVVDTEQSGMLGGAMSLGGLIGSLACPSIASRFSRRNMVILGETVIVAGVLLFAFAHAFGQVLFGRVLTGFGVGICALAKPLIVSELAPPHMRGFLVSLFAIGQSIGLNGLYLADWVLPPPTVERAWRMLVALGASPAALVVVLARCAPHSEYWDLSASSTKREELRGLGGDSPVDQLRNIFLAERVEVRRNFGLVVAMMAGYNLSGALVIANYAGEIFAAAGASDRALPIFVGVVQFLGLITAAMWIDRIGRRPLLLWSCAVTAICLYLIGALLGLQDDANGPLSPTVTPMLLVLMVAVEYAVGVGLNPIRIVLSAELMPTRYRPLGMSLGNAAGWSLSLVSLYSFPVLSAIAGGPAPQFIFFGSAVSALVVLLTIHLPETKGIELD